MATHSSVLAWRIPGTGEPGGLPSMGSHRVRHDWSDLAAAAAFQSRSIWCSLNQCILVYTSLDWSGLVYTSLHLKSVVFWYDQKFKRVQISCSVVSNSLQPHELQHDRPPCPSPTPQLPEPTQTHVESVMPSNHLILCRPLLLLPSIFPSTRVFSNESALHIRWPKYWSFSFRISPSNEY